jgi:methyl-accepting chemotaxis protein
MGEFNWEGFAVAILAFSTLIGTLGATVVNLRSNRKVVAKVDVIEAKADSQAAHLVAIDEKVDVIDHTMTQVDNAVNGRPAGSVTLGEQVETATAVLPLVTEMAPKVSKTEEDVAEIKKDVAALKGTKG